MTDTIKTLKSRRSCRKFDGRQITDEQLLEKTNGILQGMSGSPVIQNGKFVGAVTHVFIQDSTGGYGIFAENMIRCTEITTGEGLSVTGFGFGNRLRGCKNENQRTVRIQPDKKEKYV